MNVLGLCWRDLKPENILYLENKQGDVNIKICDFGISSIENRVTTAFLPNNNFFDKDMVNNFDVNYKIKFLPEYDIHNFGLVLWYLWHKELPNPKAQNITFNNNCPLRFKNFSEKCIKKEIDIYDIIEMLSKNLIIDVNDNNFFANKILYNKNLKIEKEFCK